MLVPQCRSVSSRWSLVCSGVRNRGAQTLESKKEKENFSYCSDFSVWGSDYQFNPWCVCVRDTHYIKMQLMAVHIHILQSHLYINGGEYSMLGQDWNIARCQV